MILYKSKTEIESTLIVRETNKIFQKGKFIQYLDQDQNFWSVLFETQTDIEEAVRLLEERCTIECLTAFDKENLPPPDVDNDKNHHNQFVGNLEMDKNENHHRHAVFAEGNGGCAVEVLSENDVKDKEGDNDVTPKINNTTTSCEKACETDSPNEDKSKQLKSNILSRMAKMGKRIVSPSRKLTTNTTNPTNNTELSDSSDPEVSPRRKQQLQRPHTTQNSPALQVAKLQPGPIAHSIEFMKHQPLHHASPHTMSHSVGATSASDSSLNLMLMQNTEIRFNLSKLDSKLDKLCDKIETMSANGVAGTISNTNNDTIATTTHTEDMVKMEEKLLSTKRENINLKMIIRNLEEKLNEPPDVELNELKIKLKTAQLENKNISLELNNKNEKIHLLEAKLKSSCNEKDLEATNMEVEINELKSQLEESTRNYQELKQQQRGENNLATIETQTEQETVAFSEVMIKEIMNNLYFKLCEKISGSNDMKQSEVLKIIGITIKHETGECLKKHFK